MVQRAVARHQCRVCGISYLSKSKLDEHISQNHGRTVDCPPLFVSKSDDQREFGAEFRSSTQTPWGRDLR